MAKGLSTVPRATVPRSRLSLALVGAGVGALLAGCTTPPPEAYASLGEQRVVASTPAGTDARGDSCVSRPGRSPVLDVPVARTTEIFCAGFNQPVARVHALRGRLDANAVVAGGIWRTQLDERLSCGAPQATRLGEGTPASLLSCTRRVGGLPFIALVIEGPDGTVLADGIPSTLPVMDRIARNVAPAASDSASRSDALQIEAVRLSVRAFGAGDARDYDRAMAVGRDLNLAEQYARAEDVYRSALAIQERLHQGSGADNPAAVSALAHLAINLSNQGRYREAEQFFARAERMAPRSIDPVDPIRLLHYRGLHALNQGRYEAALDLLRQAEDGYAGQVPPRLLASGAELGVGGGALLPGSAQASLIGLAEVRRVRAGALARTGRPEEARLLVTQARDLLRRVADERNVVVGRSLRTEAAAMAAGLQSADAGALLEQAAQRYRDASPRERPEAMTLFLAGQRRAAAGQLAEALVNFRAGAEILRSRQISLEPTQMLPYLDALAAMAARSPAQAQALAQEMFGAVQLAQRGQSARLVNQAAARLASGAANPDNPAVAAAVRRMQDLDQELRDLFAERDALGGERQALAAIDARIDGKQRERAEAEADVANADPRYLQLLGASATAAEVARVLDSREVLVQTLLGPQHGYTVAVRADGTVAGRRIDLGERQAGELVRRIRASIDRGPSEQRPGNQGRVPQPFDTTAAHELYSRLLGPVAAALEGAEALVVVPDGPLLALPYALLLAEPAAPDALGRAQWLVRRHAIAHTTSPQALVKLRAGAPASTAARPYIGFGAFVPPTPAQFAAFFPADRCADDARLATGLRAMPATGTEVQIAARFNGADARSVVLGQDFTVAALRAADLGAYRIIHLATHALLPGELSCVTEPAIIASPARGAPNASSAFLRSTDVLSFRLDADLVILSACNTAGPGSGVAEGAGSAGEALSGLARSFFYAGARGLLATHWYADDEVATLMVADLMRRQAAGGSSAAALRGTQLLVLEQAGSSLPAQFSHPYYWAVFAMIGDGRRQPPAPRVAAL